MFGKGRFTSKGSRGEQKSELSQEDLQQRLERLRGKPLRPRPVWLLGPMAYVLACVAGAILVLEFTEGIWLAIGLTVVAFFLGHTPELFIVFKYTKYREEWELANGPTDRRDRSISSHCDLGKR